LTFYDCGRSETLGVENVSSNCFTAGVCSGRTHLGAFVDGREAPRGGHGRRGRVKDIAAGQFELPLLFYILIALALPLRHADLVIVLLSWVFVVTCFAHAGIFATSNDGRQRSLAWLAGALVLFVMWIYFALRILLLI
jgi:hypothetical protein